jgi:hypothetical protein
MSFGTRPVYRKKRDSMNGQQVEKLEFTSFIRIPPVHSPRSRLFFELQGYSQNSVIVYRNLKLFSPSRVFVSASYSSRKCAAPIF